MCGFCPCGCAAPQSLCVGGCSCKLVHCSTIWLRVGVFFGIFCVLGVIGVMCVKRGFFLGVFLDDQRLRNI